MLKAADRLGCSYFEMLDKPIYYRNLALVILSAENKAESHHSAYAERMASLGLKSG